MDCYGQLHDPADSQCKKCVMQGECALATACQIKHIDTAVHLPVIHRRAMTKADVRRLAPYGVLKPIIYEALYSMKGIFTRRELQTRIVIYLSERGIPDTTSFSMSEKLMHFAHKRNIIRKVSRGKYELC